MQQQCFFRLGCSIYALLLIRTLSVRNTSETAFFAVRSFSSKSFVLHLSIQSTFEGCFFFQRRWVPSSGLSSRSCFRCILLPSSPPPSLPGGDKPLSASGLENKGEMPMPEPRARGTPRPLQRNRSNAPTQNALHLLCPAHACELNCITQVL